MSDYEDEQQKEEIKNFVREQYIELAMEIGYSRERAEELAWEHQKRQEESENEKRKERIELLENALKASEEKTSGEENTPEETSEEEKDPGEENTPEETSE